jgi:hypothetical protein
MDKKTNEKKVTEKLWHVSMLLEDRRVPVSGRAVECIVRAKDETQALFRALEAAKKDLRVRRSEVTELSHLPAVIADF